MAGTEAERGGTGVDVVPVVVGVGDAEVAGVLVAVAVGVADEGSLVVVVDEGVGDSDVVSGVGELHTVSLCVLPLLFSSCQKSILTSIRPS